MSARTQLQVASTPDEVTLSLVTTEASVTMPAPDAATIADQLIIDIEQATAAGRTHVSMTVAQHTVELDLDSAAVLVDHILEQCGGDA